MSTAWYALRDVESGELEAVLQPWLEEERASVVDGKRLRGSKRRGERALAVLTMVGQELGKVVAQLRVDAENELTTALALLEEVPLAGKVVNADAASVHAPVVQPVVKQGGFIELMNNHQPDLNAAVAAWITWWSQQRGNQPAYHTETGIGHGRSEQCDVWMVPCDIEMQHYLQPSTGDQGCSGVDASAAPERRRPVRKSGCMGGWQGPRSPGHAPQQAPHASYATTGRLRVGAFLFGM